MMMKPTKNQRRRWWYNLTDEQKSEFIAKQERNRKHRVSRIGEREQFPNGAVKIWHSENSYSVYKKEMLDKAGNPLPEWL